MARFTLLGAFTSLVLVCLGLGSLTFVADAQWAGMSVFGMGLMGAGLGGQIGFHYWGTSDAAETGVLVGTAVGMVLLVLIMVLMSIIPMT